MRLLILLVSICCVLSTSAYADRVYKHVDEAGNVSFSTKPPHQGAKPAKLPEISRGEMKLVENPLETCANHGGIDCSKGPSSSGSVICLDGYTGAAARFLFSCSSAKLEIAQIADPQDESFSVVIRNLKSVKAEGPELYLKQGESEEITLVGPSEIEGYGVGEFVLDMKDLGAINGKPDKKDFRLLCKNCS